MRLPYLRTRLQVNLNQKSRSTLLHAPPSRIKLQPKITTNINPTHTHNPALPDYPRTPHHVNYNQRSARTLLQSTTSNKLAKPSSLNSPLTDILKQANKPF